MKKTGLIKIWRVTLGITAEIFMTIFIMAVALGLSWLFVKTLITRSLKNSLFRPETSDYRDYKKIIEISSVDE